MEIAAGIVIGERYRLVRAIGEGGMGVVWAADDLVTRDGAALKLLKPGAGDPDAARRFLREARAASAVRHPNVVRTLDVLELADGSPALVMELLEGESLRDLLVRERTLGVGELAALLLPVVSAVGAAHELGIVHRDLKPENVFLARGPAGARGSGTTGERVVKVLDFGIAKLTALDGEAMRSTGVTTGAVLGTPAYMAPEQVFAEADLDHRADIWALGLIAYQCLSGSLPTHGDNVGQVLKNVLAKPFEPLEQLVPGVPPALAQLIARMVARERTERPADLREVFAILAEMTDVRPPDFGPPAEPLVRDDDAATRETLGPRRAIPRTAFLIPAPSSPTAPLPTARVRTLRTAATLAVAIGAAAAGLVGWRLARSGDPPPAPIALLGAPDARLACPVLEASGVDEPAGWLGAAAAATACERARVILGGRPERTLVPAELLDLPRRPGDGYPVDPYVQPTARPVSIAAAQARASAYLDGRVQHTRPGFRVVLELRARDAHVVARGEGSGRGLGEAVRAAMAPLIGPAGLPRAAKLDPEIAAWQRTDDVDAALAMIDVNLAMAHNAGGLADECERFAAISPRLGELGPAWRWLCARTMGRPAPAGAAATAAATGTGDTSPAAIATRIRIRHVEQRIDDPADADALHRQFARDPSSWGRSLAAATESCLVQSSDPARAYDMALAAIEAEPKNPDGQPCDPWSQLMTMAQHKPIAASATRAMQAWQPWSSIAWFMQGLADPDPAAALTALRRAYELSPLDTQIAGCLADKLLAAGKRDDARGVARDQRAGDHPVNRIESDLLLLRIEASEAHFRRALELTGRTFEISPADAGWVHAQRFEVAWRALEIAGIVGTARELADQLVERFLDPAPSPLDGSATDLPARLAAICALASPKVAPRCFARFAALRPRLSGAITEETDALLEGAQHYARHDVAAAARAWRPLLRGAAPLAAVLPDAMAEVFAAAGNPELADKVDAAVMARAGEFGGATLAHARAARRALRRGDRDAARALADQVIAAWQFADEAVPAVADMHRLLEQLARR